MMIKLINITSISLILKQTYLLFMISLCLCPLSNSTNSLYSCFSSLIKPLKTCKFFSISASPSLFIILPISLAFATLDLSSNSSLILFRRCSASQLFEVSAYSFGVCKPLMLLKLIGVCFPYKVRTLIPKPRRILEGIRVDCLLVLKPLLRSLLACFSVSGRSCRGLGM
jgi:hypothetical protein